MAGNFNGTRGGRKGRELLARMNSCLSSWRPHRRRLDGHRESRRRGGKAEPRGTRPRGGGSPASLSAPAAKQGGTAVSHRSGVQHTGGEDLLPRGAIHPLRHESRCRWHELRRRESSAVRAPRWQSNLVQALYHGRAPSDSLTDKLGAKFSLDFQ